MAGTGEPCAKKNKSEADIPKLPERKIKLLREAMNLLEERHNYSFNLLKITKSNADMSVPFSKCFLQIERSSDFHQLENSKLYSFGSVFVKGFYILKQYLEDPGNVREDKEVRIALQRLTTTLLMIEGL